jgi:hypothetical protein
VIARGLKTLLAVVFYIGGSMFHTWALSGNLGLYHTFDDQAPIPFLHQAWEALAQPALPWIVIPVIVFEFIVGLMMLGKGRTAKQGQLLGALWNLFLAGFDPWYWANLIMVALHGWLYTQLEQPLPSPRGGLA